MPGNRRTEFATDFLHCMYVSCYLVLKVACWCLWVFHLITINIMGLILNVVLVCGMKRLPQYFQRNVRDNFRIHCAYSLVRKSGNSCNDRRRLSLSKWSGYCLLHWKLHGHRQRHVSVPKTGGSVAELEGVDSRRCELLSLPSYSGRKVDVIYGCISRRIILGIRRVIH
jgi:hypothetical protein